MQKEWAWVLTTIAGSTAILHKSMIDINLRTWKGVFNCCLLRDWFKRECLVLKKNQQEPKKKNQRKEETFSQVINNP